MDRKTMSVAVVIVAIAFLAITYVTASPRVSINTPLYNLRMEQVSSGKNFSPAQMSGFTYTAGNGYNLNYGVSGWYGAEPLADPTKPPACQTYECTCPFDCTIDYTCDVTCKVQCVNTWSTCVATCNTCAQTCGSTCGYTCDDETCYTCPETCGDTCGDTCAYTCVNTCETCVYTCQNTCWDTCPDTCWTCDVPNP